MSDYYPIFEQSLGEIVIKNRPQDFIVSEKLRFEPEGEGDHLYLYIEKVNANTEWVQRQLAKLTGLKRSDVGYAGLKDRHAITRQWFSLYAPINKEFTFDSLPDNVSIIETTRGRKKLKTAGMGKNEFNIQFCASHLSKTQINTRFNWIKDHGYANYFGAQRFGHDGNNIDNLIALAGGKRFKSHQRSLFISAGRSYLFNLILSERVRQNIWNKLVSGDVAILNNSRSIFAVDNIDNEITQRLEQFDIHPAIPLYGSGEWISNGQVKELEHEVYNQHRDIVKALLDLNVTIMPRASRVVPEGMQWEFTDDNMCLKFTLPAGAFATTLLDQAFDVQLKNHYE